MTQAKAGDTVAMHYTGTLADGSEFDTSRGREPMEFKLGSGQIIPGLDRGMTGMAVGETRTVTVAPEDGYGAHDPDRVQAVPRAQIPADIPTDPGTMLQMQTPEGQTLPVTVVKADADSVTLDANHPLAGQVLNFDVELVEIRNAA